MVVLMRLLLWTQECLYPAVSITIPLIRFLEAAVEYTRTVQESESQYHPQHWSLWKMAGLEFKAWI